MSNCSEKERNSVPQLSNELDVIESQTRLFNDSSRLTPPVKFLVPRLCLGTDCSRGSASLRNASETRKHDESAGRACKSVGSKVEPAEPWNQLVAISEKCLFNSPFLALTSEVACFLVAWLDG